MKIKNIFGLTLLFVAALCMQSCHDSEDVAATGLTVTKDGSAIESLDFSIGGSYVMLGVNTDADWTASIPEADSTWLSITPHAGYGWAINDTASSNTRSYFKVTVAKNKSDARTSTITVNAGNLSKVINVSQKGTNRITCGLGFRIDRCYMDLAYQYSTQKGDFYPFSSYVDNTTTSDNNIPTMTKIENKRHQVLFTLGYKF